MKLPTVIRDRSTQANFDRLAARIGSDLASVDAAETTASATFTDLATVGPSLTIPESGIYIVTVGAFMRSNTVGATSQMSFNVGSTGALDADSARFDTAVANLGVNACAARKKTLTQGTVLLAKYKSGGTGLFVFRWLKYERIG